MSFWEILKNIFSAKPIELKLTDSFELKKAFDARRVGVRGRAQYPETNFDNLFRQAYRNELVFACLEKIGQCALDPEIVVERKNKNGEWERMEGHPLVALWQKPNPLDTGDSFLRAWLISEHISDRAVAEIVRSRSGQPVQLWLLNPARIMPVASDVRDGNPVAYYEYKTEDGQKIRLAREDVLLRLNRSITNQFYGVSPLAVALGSVDADSAMTDYIRAFFNNAGMPSGILKFSNRTLTDEQAEITRQQWRNRYGRGGRHAGGIGVLDQNAEFQKIGSNLDELESDSVAGRFETRICQVFGVPPILVGAYVGLLHVNQRASVKEAQNDFWLNKMSPLFKSLRQFLTWNLLPEFEDIEEIKRGALRVNWDMSQVMALQEDLDKHHDRARKNFLAGGLTLNEFRAEIGKPEDPQGDYYLRPASAQLQTATASAQIAEITGARDNQENPPKLLPPAEIEKKTFFYEGLILAREPNEREKKLDLKAINREFESHQKRLAQVLTKMREDLLEQLVRQIDEDEPDKIHALVLTPPPQARKNLRRVLQSAFAAGQNQIARELAQQKNLSAIEIKADSQSDEEELDFLSDITISRAVSEIQARFSADLAKFLVLGFLGKKLIEKLKETFKNASLKFLENIAARSASKAVNLGRETETGKREGEWTKIQYSAIFDKNLCRSCKRADGRTATNQKDLPRVPNPECEGGDQCRCFHVVIAD